MALVNGIFKRKIEEAVSPDKQEVNNFKITCPDVVGNGAFRRSNRKYLDW